MANAIDLEDGWLTHDEAARLYGRSRSTIKRWLASGRIPSVDVCGQRRIHLSLIRSELPVHYELLQEERSGT